VISGGRMQSRVEFDFLLIAEMLSIRVNSPRFGIFFRYFLDIA
jgi:hypothetical protein